MGLLIATLAVYSLLLRPTYTEVNQLRGTYSASANAFIEQRKVIDKVRKLIAQYQGTTKIQDTIALTLPGDQSVASLIGQLRAIASASGLTIQSINVQTVGALKPVAQSSEKGVRAVGTVQASMAMVGSYEALKTFVGGIESNIRLMDIAEWRAEPVAKGNGSVLSFSMVIHAYFQGE
jgi:Tfp pilus assembly protein PilO